MPTAPHFNYAGPLPFGYCDATLWNAIKTANPDLTYLFFKDVDGDKGLRWAIRVWCNANRMIAKMGSADLLPDDTGLTPITNYNIIPARRFSKVPVTPHAMRSGPLWAVSIDETKIRVPVWSTRSVKWLGRISYVAPLNRFIIYANNGLLTTNALLRKQTSGGAFNTNSATSSTGIILWPASKAKPDDNYDGPYIGPETPYDPTAYRTKNVFTLGTDFLPPGDWFELPEDMTYLKTVSISTGRDVGPAPDFARTYPPAPDAPTASTAFSFEWWTYSA